jgi:hypothetical protein
MSGIDPPLGRWTPAAEFEGLARAIYQRLPVASLRKDSAPGKAELLRAYAESDGEIGACVEDLARLREAVFLAMVEVRNCDDESRYQKALENALQVVRDKVGPVRPIRLPPLTAALVASETADGLARLVRQQCAQAAGKVVTETIRLLEQLTEGERVKWHGDGVAEIRFKRVVIVEEPVPGTRWGYNASTRARVEYRDFLRTRRTALHHHQLVNASKVALPAKPVPKPVWVEDLIREIPDWLKSYSTIVTGDLFAGRVIEKDEESTTVSETTGATYRPDPALLIGEHVIGGWTDLDLEADRQEKLARLDAQLDAAAHAIVAPFVFVGRFLGPLVLTGLLPFTLRFPLPFLAGRELYRHLGGTGWLALGAAVVAGLVAHTAATAVSEKFIPTSTPSRESR